MRNSPAVRYCADAHLSVLDPIMKLEGVVDSLCIVGASREYAHRLILELWGYSLPTNPDVVKELYYCRAPSRAYPLTPGQRSAFDYGPPRGVRVVRHDPGPSKQKSPASNVICPSIIVTKPDGEGLSGGACVKASPKSEAQLRGVLRTGAQTGGKGAAVRKVKSVDIAQMRDTGAASPDELIKRRKSTSADMFQEARPNSPQKPSVTKLPSPKKQFLPGLTPPALQPGDAEKKKENGEGGSETVRRRVSSWRVFSKGVFGKTLGSGKK